MLGTIKIGAPDVSSVWELEKDSYGISFLKNSSIRQRIRIGKNVKDTLKEMDLFENTDEVSYSQYEIGGNSFISNSYSNMSLALLNFFSEDEDVKNQHVDDNIIFVIVDSDKYQMIEYTAPFTNEIVSTFKDKNTHHYGCAVVTNNTDEPVLIMNVYNIENHCYSTLTVSINSDGYLTLKTTECDDDLINRLKPIKSRLSKRVKSFSITNKSGKLFTKAYLYYSEENDYVCNNGMKLSTFVDETMKNALFINTKDLNDIEDIKKALQTANVRCVTIVDGDYDANKNKIKIKVGENEIILPAWKFAMDTFQSYVFRLNSFTGSVTCIKSN